MTRPSFHIARDERVRDLGALHRLAADRFDDQADFLRKLIQANERGNGEDVNRFHERLACSYEDLRTIMTGLAELYDNATKSPADATLKELTDLLQLRARETPVEALRSLMAREANARATAADLRKRHEELADLHGAFDMLARIRRAGYVVACHNDYKQDGMAYTFWLFTKNGFALKGEGASDEEALSDVEKQIERRQFGDSPR